MGFNVVGKYIRHLKDINGMTQVKLAEVMGCSPQTVSNRLSGSAFRHKELLRLSDFFDVSVDTILNGGEVKKTELLEFYEMDISEMVSEDVPAQPDSDGKTLIDYITENDDYEKFSYFYKHDYELGSLHQNSKFTAFLMRHKDHKKLQNGVVSKYRTVTKRKNDFYYVHEKVMFPSLGVYDNHYKDVVYKLECWYLLLTSNHKEFIEEVLKCQDPDILDYLPYKETKVAEYHLIYNLALLKDNIFLYDYLLKRDGEEPEKEHYDFAVEVGSKLIAQHIKEWMIQNDEWY